MSRTHHTRRPRRPAPQPAQRPVKSHLVGYTLTGAHCERDVEALLRRAVAAGVVLDFGADSYDDSGTVWFNGMPGPALRELRRDVAALVALGPCPGHGRRG